MSVKVNLIPGDIAKRERAGQIRNLVGLGFVVLLAILAFVYFQQAGALDDANDELLAEQATLADLEADQMRLQEFGDLRDRRDEAVDLLVVALGAEASLAGVLQDVAAVMPPDSELDSLSINTQIGVPELGDERAVSGSLTMTGRSLRGHAPGLERLLIEFDKIAGFSDLYFAASTLEEIEGVTDQVVGFDVQIDLGPEILTGRYADGLPEGLR